MVKSKVLTFYKHEKGGEVILNVLEVFIKYDINIYDIQNTIKIHLAQKFSFNQLFKLLISINMLFERHHVSVQSDGTCSYVALVITFKLRFKWL